ncbi:MAG: glycosyltransferase, partial [Pseudomonadota bacterium]
TLRSIELADKLITLHNIADLVIPKEYHYKVHVIYQSADFLKRKINKNKKNFDVCVIGHLREEKDPLRAAYAVRKLPISSRIRVKQYGKAHTEIWAQRAEKEMQINSRYKWYGEVPHWKINQLYASADIMVLSSKMEGGANVISEACAAGMPVIASKIDGTIGLLGKTYPGYYPYADTTALKNALLKAESDTKYLKDLTQSCKAKANLFTYTREKNSMNKLLNDLL